MKVADILQQYAEGRRDFRNLSLRGKSFQGQNLSGADFSGCDLRGTNFKGAILKGTIFRQAKAGLQKRWVVILVLISWLISAFFGFFSYFNYIFILQFFRSDAKTLEPILGIMPILGIIINLFLISILIVIIRQGLNGAVAIAVAFTLLSGYLGWRSLREDPRYKWIRQIAIAFAAISGTSFYGADLIEADFTQATLKSTDFREANLTRTCWQKTKKSDRVRPGKTLLANPAVRDLMVTRKVESQSYERANLRGANLKGVHLNYASLKFADLSEATLEEANLEYANLTEVNAVETDFTRAKMTGVCLEAWNIESNTILDEVDCKFVYLLEHPKSGTDDRERRPSSGIFQPGEFTKLFQEVLNTVDLIFQDGVDWKAFITAFKKLQIENEDIPLEIQSIENKGDGVVVVKVAVPPDTNKEKVHQDFTQKYERELKLIEDKYKTQLNAKENEIAIYRQTNADMKEIAQTLANRPIKLEAKAVGQEKINQQGNFGIGVNQGEISGNAKIAGVFKEDKQQDLAEAAAQIQALLEQLSQTYPTNTRKGKMIIAGEAVEEIEKNPQLTQRLLSAAKAGSLAAIESMLNHPAASFVIAALEDLQESENQ